MANEAEPLSGEQALEELSRAGALHGALEARATGLTWLVWGLAVPGIFVTYNMFGLITQVAPEFPPILFAIAWVPWVAMGVLATTLLWRSIGLVIPVRMGRRDAVLGAILFLILIPVATWAAGNLGSAWVEPALALTVLGGVYVLAGMAGWTCRTRGERWTWMATGALYVGVAVSASLLIGQDADRAYAVFSFLAPGVVFVTQGIVGTYWATRT